jgi:hypothetical protein
MKNALGGQFYFFQARRRGPTRVRPATHPEALNEQAVPRSVLGSESSNREKQAMRVSRSDFLRNAHWR